MEDICPFPSNPREIACLLVIKPSQLFFKDKFEAAARKVFARCDVICPDDLTHLARVVEKAAKSYQLLLAGGGDGTLNRALQSLDRERLGAGVVALGSGNDFARNFDQRGGGIAGRFAAFADGEWRRVDLVRAGGILYHNSGGFGLDAETLATRERSSGKLARNYGVAFLRTIPRLKPMRCRLTLDGRAVEGDYLWVLAMNNPWIGGGMLAAPRARFDDGLLDIVLVRNITKLRLAALFPLVYAGKHTKHPAVACMQGRMLDVECDAPIGNLALDGELYRCEDSRITFTVEERCVWFFGAFKTRE
jgi:diacylglycerol kinase (ATP)